MKYRIFIIGIVILSLLKCVAGAVDSNENIIVIMYHDFTSNPMFESSYRINPIDLENDIVQFRENGYTFVKADQLTNEYIETSKNNKFVCLTFDDGYESLYFDVYPILKKYNVCATFYIITSRISKSNHLNEQQIKEMSDSGLVEIGSHGHYIHLNSFEFNTVIYNDENKRKDAVIDFKTSADVLNSITGKKITSLSYPNGVYNLPMDEEIRKSLNINVTISTDFGVNNINNLGKPIRRINRDLEFTSQTLFDLTESMCNKK